MGFFREYPREHRPYNTEDGWFCDAGDDCPICEEMWAEEEEEEEDGVDD